MRIFLDTSDVDVIRKHCETRLIDGVTTNPTLMMQAGRDPIEVIKEISSLFPEHASISAEVVGDTAEEMVSQAEDYYSISKNITIKVPCTVEGLKACKMLSDKDISVNVTLIFSVEQAILSAKSGATYVSPFIGRCEDNNIDGIDLIKSIKKVYSMNNISTNILAASIRNVPHVGQAFEVGADIVTLPPSIFEEMYKHNLTDQGIKQFDKDWKKLNS
ncbi:MAG: transaldolase family protein [Candidatus Neomarinimicrobiota bacterium]|jgi:transaldolase|nr:transaldolase family protein [Candidatus Neomarinimicrobiota bacterium]